MYIPLYIKTDYSLLSSLIKIDELINYLKKLNINACAIVDNNLFGTMEIINKFNKNNIKPIIGLEINYNNKIILLYAKNELGYKNLIKIETYKNENDITIDILTKYKDNLISIVFDIDLYNELKNIYNDIFIGVNNKEDELKLTKITKDIVFINKTLYLEKYLYKYLPYIFMIRDSKTIKDKVDFTYQNNHLLSYEEIKNEVSNLSIENTIKINNMCNLKLSKELYMPKYMEEGSKEFLINLANKGLKKRLGNVNDIYQKRLDYELSVIINMNFIDYFLVVYDYIKYAKKNGILVGPGRGSAAGSLVSYSLGITDIDPIKYGLLFERFLNPERVSMPDIDTDFPDVDREKVINYVKEKYGKENVAGIITFGTLALKQAIRDAGRVLEIPIKEIDYITKKVTPNISLKELRYKDKEIDNLFNSSNKYKLLYNLVNIITNNKRHTSIHAAGIVISRTNLKNVVPIIKSDDLYLTEYTMEYLEQIGLIKMDFLGIKNLSIIKNIINDIEKYENIKIDFNRIPLDDKNVIKIFESANTTGIFQFESAGMRRFLKDLKPQNFSDICAAIALFRPGPAENIPSYIKRKNGKEKIDYIVPELKDILEETYGIIIYQEQIMQIASKMASFTLGEADILRKAMSKKKLDILKNEEEKFIKGSINNGYTKEKAEEVYNLILKFAGYGFNKSHSVSYSVVAYKMAYLKSYFPKYFYANLLGGVIGSDVKTLEYIKEIKKLGIKVLPPDINLSLSDKYLVTNKGIIMPLSVIRNVGIVISNFITEERTTKYIDIFDFLKRTYKKTNNKKVIESLIYSHTFDNMNNIGTLINNIESITNYIELSNDLEDNIIPKPELIFYPNNENDILEKEKELFGFYLTNHKTEKYKLNDNSIIDIEQIKNYYDKVVSIIINIDRKKEITTKNGDLMAFITGSDNTSSISITLFSNIYKDYTNLTKGDIIKVTGKVEKRYDELQIIARTIEVKEKII